MEKQAAPAAAGGKKRKFATAGLIVFALGLAYFIYDNYTFVATDNATIQAHTLMLSSKVGGVVSEVLVDENQKVKMGQVLAKLDQREFVNAVHEAESDLGSIQARMRDAETNFKRLSGLLAQNAVSRQQYDNAEAAYKDASKRYLAVQAQVENAKLNLSYTEIKAPADGSVARKSVETGMVVPPGQALFGFVSSGSRWVTANFKETDMPQITPGKHASIEVDALPHQDFEGVVESVSPSTGAIFSLLPPENATGNFTKVVQRVPVRIRLEGLTEGQVDALRAGLSAFVKVRIR